MSNIDNYTITIKNKRIWEFYQNSNWNFEETNLLFIDFFEKTNFINSSFDDKTSHIIRKLNDIDDKLMNEANLKNEFFYLNTNIKEMIEEKNKIAIMTINETKNSYINDLKLLINENNTSSNNDLINDLTTKNNDIITNINNYNKLFERKLENELLKMTTSTNTKQIELLEKQKSEFHSHIENEINKLLSSNISKNAFEIYVNNIEKKMETISVNIASLNKINDNSYLRGLQSENTLEELLLRIFTNVDITKISHIDHCCDILYNDTEDIILIENKCYRKNVPTMQVNKFQKDCITNNHCGLMIQQEEGYGICGKQDFEFEITSNNNVLLYLHNCNYSCEKIKTAVNIIKFFKKQLIKFSNKNNENESNIIINNQDFAKLKKEYELLIHKNNSFVGALKKSIKTMKDEIDSMNFILKSNEENKFVELNNLFNFEVSNCYFKTEKVQCEFCDKLFSAQGLGPHRKSCKKNEMNLVSNK
jgi:hypothetical protein